MENISIVLKISHLRISLAAYSLSSIEFSRYVCNKYFLGQFIHVAYIQIFR